MHSQIEAFRQSLKVATMNKNFFTFFLFGLLLSPFWASTQTEAPIVIRFQVKTTLSSSEFPLLVATKDWNKEPVFKIDLTSNSNYGKTLASGLRRGWAVFLQENGAWGWNLGNEMKRLDYMPTSKQQINDGKWHEIALFFDQNQQVVHFAFDQKIVAIYNYKSTPVSTEWLQENLIVTNHPQIKVRKLKISDEWKFRTELTSEKDQLKVVSWNIWHGGRRNGIQQGLKQTIDLLKEQEADLILLQETYGSGPIIADSLGMQLFLISSNLSILSKLPFAATFCPWDDFRMGGAILQHRKNQYFAAFDIWLNYLPDTDKLMNDGVGFGEFYEAELQTRGREALQVFKAFNNLNLKVPSIFGGDFNSGSHLDWTLANTGKHKGYYLPWPVSRTMYREGFTDTYRNIYSDSSKDLGYTWSPKFKDGLQYRIDHIYQEQAFWKTLDAGVEGYDVKDWPSDHAMVWAVLQLGAIRP